MEQLGGGGGAAMKWVLGGRLGSLERESQSESQSALWWLRWVMSREAAVGNG